MLFRSIADELGNFVQESSFGDAAAAVDLDVGGGAVLSHAFTPQAYTPCDQDWRVVIRTMPREPLSL